MDLNSSYSYLLWCKHFSETSVVVKENDTVVGFVSGFIPPSSENVLFIWQVAVAETERKQGLATRMIEHILERNACGAVEFIEATVSPSNSPSQKLFKGIAEKRGVPYRIASCFEKEDFPDPEHEEENTYRIGPLK